MSDEHTTSNTPGYEVERSQYMLKPIEGPLLNFTLSTVCPACNYPTIRRACKVRCELCGFMWDCSEL
jgi:hypothetical protein